MVYIAEPLDPANQLCPSNFCPTAIDTEPSVVPTRRLVPRRPITEDGDNDNDDFFANQRGKRNQRVDTAGRWKDPDTTSRSFDVHIGTLPCHEHTSATERAAQLSGERDCVSTKLVPAIAQILPLETELQHLAIRRRRREFESAAVDACTTLGAFKYKSTTGAC